MTDENEQFARDIVHARIAVARDNADHRVPERGAFRIMDALGLLPLSVHNFVAAAVAGAGPLARSYARRHKNPAEMERLYTALERFEQHWGDQEGVSGEVLDELAAAWRGVAAGTTHRVAQAAPVAGDDTRLEGRFVAIHDEGTTDVGLIAVSLRGEPIPRVIAFATEEELLAFYAARGVKVGGRARIEDGRAFLRDLPSSWRVIVNFKDLGGGRIQFNEVQRG